MKKNIIFYVIIGIIVIAGVALDMITKHITMGVNTPIINGVVSAIFTWNTGAGWSILSDQTLILTIFSALLVIALILLVIFYRPQSKLFSIGTGLVLAGAIGNLIDRILFGAVRDFIHLDFMSFPIFNVADILLTFGAIIMGIWLVFFWGKKGKKENGK